jgi:hypothetical protein
LGIEAMRRGTRRLFAKLLRLEPRPDPLLISRPPPGPAANDRAAAE